MGEATRPRRRPGPGLALAVAIHVAVATVPAGGTANANWLSKLVREAGEAGGKGVSRSGHGALDAAALHLKSLPGGPDSTAAFAAHVTPEGHWTFANRAGEVYTAGTADEMSRVVAALAPGLAGQKPRLVLYLSDETVFSGRALLKDLPADAELHVVLGRASHPLVSRTEGGAVRLYAEVRPNVALRLDERHAVEERKLSRAALETLAIIAYHQPVTRAEIEEIRGVSTSKGTIDVLLETGWIRPRGRRRAPGRPVTYGTTDGFLDHFGLDQIRDLPGLAELKGAGLLDGNLPPGFSVPEPTDVAALMPDELPLEAGDDGDEQSEMALDLPDGEETDNPGEPEPGVH